METVNLILWLVVFGAIAAFGLGVMVWAYARSGGAVVVFSQPVAWPADPSGAVADGAVLFQNGCVAFQAGQFRRAIEQFTAVIQKDEAIAEAHHNLGLAYANLRQDNDALRALLQAGELYDRQSNEAAIALVKTQLETLKAARAAKTAGSASA